MNKLNKELEWKLSCALNTNDRQESFLLTKNKDLKSTKLRDTFFKLNDTTYRVNKLISMYEQDNNFLYKMPLEDIFKEEEKFTTALTKYTQEQFAGGIASFATKKDKLNYSYHDLNRPGTFLLSGQDSYAKQVCRSELDRHKSVYLKNKQNEIFAGMSTVKYKKMVEIAKKQLAALKNCSGSQLSRKDLPEITQKLQDDIKQKHRRQNIFYNSEMLPILLELKSNSSAKVIQGNFDLKLLRQNYFLNKQNHVIEQLLAQHSRHKLLNFVYKAEQDMHTETYHLVSSLEYLLKKEVIAIESRVSSLTDLSFLSDCKADKDFSDEFSLAQPVLKIDIETKQSELMNKRKEINLSLQKSNSYFQTVDDEIREKKIKFEKIENELSKVSRRINEIVEYLSKKRDLITRDAIESRKRRVMDEFFNEPLRLKK